MEILYVVDHIMFCNMTLEPFTKAIIIVSQAFLHRKDLQPKQALPSNQRHYVQRLFFFGSGNELLNSENELLINEDLSNRNAV